MQVFLPASFVGLLNVASEIVLMIVASKQGLLDFMQPSEFFQHPVRKLYVVSANCTDSYVVKYIFSFKMKKPHPGNPGAVSLTRF